MISDDTDTIFLEANGLLRDDGVWGSDMFLEAMTEMIRLLTLSLQAWSPILSAQRGERLFCYVTSYLVNNCLPFRETRSRKDPNGVEVKVKRSQNVFHKFSRSSQIGSPQSTVEGHPIA